MELRTAGSGQDSVEQRLAAEFNDRVSPETIRMVAAEEVAAFASARVRRYISILAWRQARSRIRAQLGPKT